MKQRDFFAGLLGACILFTAAAPLSAQTITSAHSQLRRTIDPSPRSAYGSVLIMKAGNTQTFEVQVKQLGDDSFGIFLADKISFNTNCCLSDVAPLDRTNAKNGTWMRKLVGTGGAPPEFVSLGLTDLSDLANTEIDISQPGIPFISTILTNIVAGVTNIVGGVTNIVGNTTNVIFGVQVPTMGETGSVFSALWAPLPPLSTNPKALSFNKRGLIGLPPGIVGPPSPKAAGTIKITFNGVDGRSVLDVRAVGLTRGQQYTVFIANSTNTESYALIPAGDMTLKANSSSARFLRDTKFGDPLPQQVPNVGDLAGRVIEIRDAFFDTHLYGIIPAIP